MLLPGAVNECGMNAPNRLMEIKNDESACLTFFQRLFLLRAVLENTEMRKDRVE